jgi:hypothetical protein
MNNCTCAWCNFAKCKRILLKVQFSFIPPPSMHLIQFSTYFPCTKLRTLKIFALHCLALHILN